MKICDRIMVCLPTALAGVAADILGVYSYEMHWPSKILVYISNGLILFTSFILSEKIERTRFLLSEENIETG